MTGVSDMKAQHTYNKRQMNKLTLNKLGKLAKFIKLQGRDGKRIRQAPERCLLCWDPKDPNIMQTVKLDLRSCKVSEVKNLSLFKKKSYLMFPKVFRKKQMRINTQIKHESLDEDR